MTRMDAAVAGTDVRADLPGSLAPERALGL